MKRFYYSSTVFDFLVSAPEAILGELVQAYDFPALRGTQRDAWLEQISILKQELSRVDGVITLEYAVPRMGTRVDAVLIAGDAVFIIEFKVGSESFDPYAIDQVHDYALDLSYFHEPSHNCRLVPLLIASRAEPTTQQVLEVNGFQPTCIAPSQLGSTIEQVTSAPSGPSIDPDEWLNGRYSPTPTIIEAALALFRGHEVEDISRNDAGGESLKRTSDAVSDVIVQSRDREEKSICFVTGVPGAGKTLVGINVANQHTDQESGLLSFFLSGNGPLVAVLKEALARDAIRMAALRGERLTKSEARSRVKRLIQNVHHFRDECIRSPHQPPVEHVALFDEAQRAWNQEQTSKFMQQKKKLSGFSQSEPAYLISCLDRHVDWATVVCLVGGGQEINTGEGGIREWIDALQEFPRWNVHVSPHLTDAEFDPGAGLDTLKSEGRVTENEALHLYASMRSFRAENVSQFVKALLDLDVDQARRALDECRERFPIVLTRSLSEAKDWVRSHARGSERYGLVVSSAAERLRPHAIHVKAPMDPVHWFLDGKDDVRSAYYMEDVATEFHIQGLELDWTCVVWDADFRYSSTGWQNFDFVGSRWHNIRSKDRQRYQKNAYRVLLTRARQGMAVVVPEGNKADATRSPEFYDGTYAYLSNLGPHEL